jgi:hypothetical protein
MTGRVNATPTPDRVSRGASSTSGARWQRVTGSLVRRTPRSLVVAVPATAAPLRIEGAAALVWESLDTPRAIEEVVTEMSREGASLSDLAGEVARTLRALETAGLVECR